MIPPVLHFIWFERERKFGLNEQYAIELALKNTSYSIVIHTNTTLPLENNDRISIKPYKFLDIPNVRACIVCDIARLEIVGVEGGIYSDIDFFWLKDWDLNRDMNLVGVYENPSYKIVCNSVFACSPNTDFTEPIQQIKDKIASFGSKSVLEFSVKNHLFGMKITGDWFKKKADFIENKRNKFFRNTWRKMERGEELNLNTTAIHLSATLNHTEKYISRLKNNVTL